MKKMLLLIFLNLSMHQVLAEDDYFLELWAKVEMESNAIKAMENKKLSSNEESKKAHRHWYPEVYAGGATFFTNDPGSNMFGLLSQRKISQSDFMPQQLNEPQMNHFTKATLGAELSLYQGGAGSNYEKMANHLEVADQQALISTKKKLLQEFFKIISDIHLISKYQKYYSEKGNELNKLKSNYQIGQKENLLGYSGKLGMDNLHLKIQAADEMLASKKKSLIIALENMTKMKFDHERIAKIDIEKKWKDVFSSSFDSVSDETKVIESQAKAMESATDLAKARLRPQVALFADQSYFKGDRDIADAQTIGLSVKWSLFSSENLSTESKALYNYYAAKNMHLAKAEEDKIKLESLSTFEDSLEQIHKKMMASKELLSEQSQTTYKLFKNGLINILQHLEVLNQDLDLNSKIYDIEENRNGVKIQKIMYLKNISWEKTNERE